MTVEIKLISITVQDADGLENFTGMLPVSLSYLPVQKPVKRRRPKKKMQTVASLIDALIENIDSGSSG